MQTLWRERQVREQEPSWISDRCSVDFGAFWLLYRFHHQRGADTDGYMTLFRERAAVYDRIVVLPFGAFPLERDGIRSANHWIQLHFQVVLEGLLVRWDLEDRVLFLPPSVDSLSERLRWVRTRL